LIEFREKNMVKILNFSENWTFVLIVLFELKIVLYALLSPTPPPLITALI
jgi:hypothetical protein